jgi:hypothetical protein
VGSVVLIFLVFCVVVVDGGFMVLTFLVFCVVDVYFCVFDVSVEEFGAGLGLKR